MTRICDSNCRFSELGHWPANSSRWRLQVLEPGTRVARGTDSRRRTIMCVTARWLRHLHLFLKDFRPAIDWIHSIGTRLALPPRIRDSPATAVDKRHVQRQARHCRNAGMPGCPVTLEVREHYEPNRVHCDSQRMPTHAPQKPNHADFIRLGRKRFPV